MEHKRAMRRAIEQRESELVFVLIDIIGQDPWSGNNQRRIFVHTIRIVVGYRGIIHRFDRKRHHGNARFRQAIAELVSKGIQAVVIWSGNVNERTIVRE